MRNALVLAVMFSLVGCLGEAEPQTTNIEVAVAPLSLSGITNAQYTVTVTNAPAGAGEVVWSRTITSDQYGDGAGSITYVGPCDGGKRHTVTLTLDALYAGGLLDAGTYENPTPVRLEADCLENRDTPVRFDITLMRQADQGFFDVAVQFEDIFCSAKLDCQTDSGSDLDLLFNGQTRDMTAVLGFACISGEGQTYLYMDDLVIDCGGTLLDVRVAPTGMGDTTPTSNPNNYLFAAATYRGLGEGGVAYWNVGLGLNAAAFATMGACTLTTRATASSTPWDQEVNGFPFPPATVYPVISWQAPLTNSSGRVCTRHEVGTNEVQVDYLGYLPTNAFTWSDATLYMQHRLTPAANGGTVVSAGSPICNPSCDHGTCVSTNVCDCDAGWEGPSCDEPVCTGGCGPGSCVAPDTCDCLGTGFFGDTCGDDIDECALDTDGCDQGCENNPGGFDCTCDQGYTLDVDGVTCLGIDECTTGQHECDPNARCTDLPGSYECACDPGYTWDGSHCAACDGGLVKEDYGNEACVPCELGTYDDGTETCATCTTCNPGEFVANACTPTQDTQCSTCSTCNPGEEVSLACGESSDTSCTSCPSGTRGDGTQCLPCMTGTVQPFPGQSACEVCLSGFYAQDTIHCRPCTTCGGSEYTSAPCSAAADTTCADCTSVSLCTGTLSCSDAFNSVCSQCAPGYVQLVAGAACTDIDECANNNGGCGANGTCTNTAGSYTCGCVTGTYDHDGDGDCAVYANCWDILVEDPTAESGPYTVDPDGSGTGTAFQVYCDMTTDGGGWTLVLNQTDGTMRNLLSMTGEIANPSTPGAHNRVSTLLSGMTEIRYTDLAGARFLQAYINGPSYWAALQVTSTSNPVPVAYIDGPLSGLMRHIEVRNIFQWGHRHNQPTWNGTSTAVTDYDGRACLHTCWEDVNAGDRAFAGDHCNSATSPSFCPATSTGYSFPATSTRGGSFGYRKWVRSRSPASCLEWRVLGYTGNGPYTIDPDGPLGSIAPFTAYCDMSWDGGGWTLIRSTTNTDCMGSQGPVASGAAGYLSTTTVQALANRSAQVHIRTKDQAATRSATATRHTLAITNLRNARMVNEGMPVSTAGAPTAQNWSGPMVPGNLWTGCTVANLTWPSVYHACGNGSGLHLIGNSSQCGWVDNTRENMEVFVR